MRVCLCFLGCDTEKEIWRDKNEWNDFVCETNDELTKISHTPEKTLVDEAKGEMEKGGGKRQVPCRAMPYDAMPRHFKSNQAFKIIGQNILFEQNKHLYSKCSHRK